MSRLVVLVLLVVVFVSCGKKDAVEYPEPLPKDELLSFLPGVVVTDTFEFNSEFSLDGKSFFFSRDDVNDFHNIFETRFDGKSWTTPVKTSFSENEFKECDPAFSPDGKRLYYISTRKVNPTDSTTDFNIWYVERNGEDWTEPENLEIVNSDSSEFYVSFADNGNLYFASNREGGKGSFDIYVSRFVNGNYTAPENLGEGVNDEHFEHDPFVSRDESFIIFTSVNREGGFGRGDLYYSLKREGQWTPAKNLGPKFNTADYEFCPYVTRDGKYFFLSDNKDVKWISAEELLKAMGE